MPIRHSLLAVFVACVWGANFVIIDEGLADVPPLLFLAIRFTFVAFPLVLFIRKPATTWTVIIGVGAFMSLGQFSLLYLALSIGMPSGIASLVLQAQVIFTMILASVTLKERFTVRQITGALLGTTGLLTVAFGYGVGAPIVPLAVVVAAAFSWATGNVISRAGKVRSGLSLVVWSAIVVPVPALVLSMIFEGPSLIQSSLTGISTTAILSSLYTVVVSSLVGYSIWNSLMARYDASAVVPFMLLVPIVGMATAWLWQSEVPNTVELLGGVVMLTGVAIATLRRRRSAESLSVPVPVRVSS